MMEHTVNHSRLVKLENYRFSGLDASLVGAVKSVADYYGVSLSSSWIYGMTGIAFLHIVDEHMAEPNGGPPEPEVFRLVRHIGIEMEGLHVHAEGDDFRRLQAEAWDKARLAINDKLPVFAKNIDIGNQTSVIYAYDDAGYYTYSWHTGYDHSEDVIPWDGLGLSLCPCINCVNNRLSTETVSPAGGLISLHWAKPIQAAHPSVALQEALQYVIRLHEEGSYTWAGKTYYVGPRAYERWLNALENDEVDKYFFSLFIEILNEARSHAVRFLTEIQAAVQDLPSHLVDEGIRIYNDIALQYKTLRDMYPYEEPRVRELKQKERCAEILMKVMKLEEKAFAVLRELGTRIG